jgi:hypothetical protein
VQVLDLKVLSSSRIGLKMSQKPGKLIGKIWDFGHVFTKTIVSVVFYVCSPKLLSLGFANRQNVCLEFRDVLQEDGKRK